MILLFINKLRAVSGWLPATKHFHLLCFSSICVRSILTHVFFMIPVKRFNNQNSASNGDPLFLLSLYIFPLLGYGMYLLSAEKKAKISLCITLDFFFTYLILCFLRHLGLNIGLAYL